MIQMRAKSSIREPITAPRTEPTMTPAQLEWDDDDDSPLIAVEDMMEHEEHEGNGKGILGEVVRVEDGGDDDDEDDEVESSAYAEVGAVIVDEPPKTGDTVRRIFFCIPLQHG
jgi:hypothetical protein